MAHVHGAAAGAAQASKLATHGAQMIKESAVQGTAGHAAPMALSLHNAAKGAAAAGALATARSSAGKSILGRIVEHPLVLFGVGVAIGYALHKYRKEIIASATRVAEKSKDFVLQQKENLEDLVAEAGETEG